MRRALGILVLAVLLPACGGEEPRPPPGAVGTPPTKVAGPEADASRPHEVWLLSPGTAKIQVIKEVRSLTGLGLKDAKDLDEGAPRLVKDGLSRADAEAARAALEAAGARAEVR